MLCEIIIDNMLCFPSFSPLDNAVFPAQHSTTAVGSCLDGDGDRDGDGDGDGDGDEKSPQLKAKRTRR